MKADVQVALTDRIEIVKVGRIFVLVRYGDRIEKLKAGDVLEVTMNWTGTQK